ncbi:MAG: flavodoxin family protein [Deltaproteobacteria bacterium]|nr:flavodoxin family protein [Deltaproteobacteria bacterium]
MKVVAINSSPKMNKGNTALILNPFLEGMEAAGAEIELYYTKELVINPCLGCVTCWFKTPGKCVRKDDMTSLFPKIKKADTLVFATPVYVDGVSGPMKNLMDRLIPLGNPSLEIRNGHTRHPFDPKSDQKRVILVSSCGFWELDTFDPLISHMKGLTLHFGGQFAGALLRPHAEFLKPMMAKGIPLDDIFEGAKEAGRQLVKDGVMANSTLQTISRELIDQKTYVERINRAYEQAMESLNNYVDKGR